MEDEEYNKLNNLHTCKECYWYDDCESANNENLCGDFVIIED